MSYSKLGGQCPGETCPGGQCRRGKVSRVNPSWIPNLHTPAAYILLTYTYSCRCASNLGRFPTHSIVVLKLFFLTVLESGAPLSSTRPEEALQKFFNERMNAYILTLVPTCLCLMLLLTYACIFLLSLHILLFTSSQPTSSYSCLHPQAHPLRAIGDSC